VWTSAGVIAGVGVVAWTGWQPLDPIVALLVAANVVRTGVRLVGRSVAGLMDASLPAPEREAVQAVLRRYRAEGVHTHDVRTRQSGRRRFLSLHVLVPGTWSVQRGHETLERLEADLRALFADLVVLTHLEPLEDPKAYDEEPLVR
jgi:cation diffusion facilitator family transporter